MSVILHSVQSGLVPAYPALHGVPAVHAIPSVPVAPYNIPPYVQQYRYQATVPRVPAVYAAASAPLLHRGAYPLGVPAQYLPYGHRYAAPVAPVPVPVPVPGGPVPVAPGGHFLPGGPAPFVY